MLSWCLLDLFQINVSFLSPWKHQETRRTKGDGSSRPGMFFKKVFLKYFVKFTVKHCARVSFWIKTLDYGASVFLRIFRNFKHFFYRTSPVADFEGKQKGSIDLNVNVTLNKFGSVIYFVIINFDYMLG